jgi:hypothetical protein
MSREEKDDPKLPKLGNNRNDHFLAGLRALLGPVPVASAIVELFTIIIPNQRQDRCEEYLVQLAKRLDELGIKLEANSVEPEKIALIESGAVDAARAISEERIKYIVNCVADGLAESARETIHHKRLLGILAQLDDEEILILHGAATNNSALFDKLRPPAPVRADDDAGTEKYAMWTAAWSRLETLHLIEFIHETEELGRVGTSLKVPAVDVWGRRKGRHQVDCLGRMLLKYIGLSPGP